MLSTSRVVARRKSLTNGRIDRIRAMQAKIMPVPKFRYHCGLDNCFACGPKP